jgi:long-subunit fatty acid transport protein
VKNSKLRFKKEGLLLLVGLQSTLGFAAGFEKSVIWSGRYAAIGGAASSVVEGAEALYFNPAGLSKPHRLQLSANFSPTWSQFSAPIGTSNVTSDRSFSPPGAAFVSYELNPRLTLGVGYYVSAGTKAVYENVNLGIPGFTPSFKSELSATELAVGAGYEVIEDLRVGLAYRIVRIRGTLASARSLSATSLAAFSLDDISATRYNGFKLGAQYTPKEGRWGLGAEWRTEIDFTADANLSATVVQGTTVIQIPTSTASVGTVFPTQISVGGFFDVSPKVLRLIAEYTFTEYSKNKNLNLNANLTPTISLPPIALNWNNMNNYRIAAEYTGIEGLPLRAGYVLTSQVVPNSNALATFSSPGLGHTFTLGAGTTFMNSLSADIALEYSRASGTVVASEAASGTAPGDYSSNAFAAHLGVTYEL